MSINYHFQVLGITNYLKKKKLQEISYTKENKEKVMKTNNLPFYISISLVLCSVL